MPFSLEELSLIDVSIFHVLFSLTLFQIKHELPLICLAIMRDHLADSGCPVVDELTFVHVSISKVKLSWTTHFILNESSLIYILIGPGILPFPLHHTLVHFPLIYITIFEVILPHAMLFAIARFSLVNPIIIFKCLSREFKSVSNPFLTENFFRDILQLPQNDFEGSISYFFSWDIGEFAFFCQNVQLFYCN